MEVCLQNKLKVHNRYTFELRDAATGELKQEAYAENVVLNKFWQFMNYDSINLFYNVLMGDGSGEPAATDTALFHQKFSYDCSGDAQFVAKDEQYPTSSYTMRISIPADAAYTGNLTEVGLYLRAYNSYTIWTHAMLKDSEGNPITIEKTDLDILTLTVVVYVTFGTSDDNFHWMKPGPDNAVCRIFYGNAGTWGPFITAQNAVSFCDSILLDDDGCVELYHFPADCTVQQNVTGWNYSTKTFATGTKRLGTSNGNVRFYQGIIVGSGTSWRVLYPIGAIVFPAEGLFDSYTIRNMAVAIGDGSTTHFNVPIEFFVDGTEAIKVNGVTLERDVDYTIDNMSNAMYVTGQGVDASMAVSNFLQPVSGMDIPSNVKVAPGSKPQYNYLRRFPFGNFPRSGIALSEYDQCRRAIKANHPIIYKVTDKCPDNRVNKLTLHGVALCYYYSATGYPQYTVLETRQPPELPTYTDSLGSNVTSRQNWLEDLIAHPDNYFSTDTIGDLVCIVDSRGSYDSLGRYCRLIHPFSTPVYYCLYKDSGSPNTIYLRGAALGSLPGPFGSYQLRYGRQYWGGISGESHTVDGVQWKVYDTVLNESNANAYIVHDSGYLCEACMALNDTQYFTGCALKVSGSGSAQGPWTLIKSVDLGAVVRLGTSYSYGLADIDETFETASYDYYKVEFDCTNATNIDHKYGETYFFLDPTSVGLPREQYMVQLWYQGAGLDFVEAPAADAEITMDATIDRPFKNSNFVIDGGFTLVFGGDE